MIKAQFHWEYFAIKYRKIENHSEKCRHQIIISFDLFLE